MSPVTSHHARAVVGSTAAGLVLALCGALLDHPAGSAARRRLYLATGAVVALDVVVQELPVLRAALEEHEPPEPVAPEELDLRLQQGLVVGAWALLAAVADGPLSRLLGRRGVRRPHTVLGAFAAVGAALSTLPSWWRQADERAAVDRATARLDEELAEHLDQPAG